MTDRRRSVRNPADLLLRISRTPAGLHISSPQLPGWSAVARGPVPIASALDAALVQVECDSYATARGRSSDLQAWDAACEAMAASGHQVLAGDEIGPDGVVIRNGLARRRSGCRTRQRQLTRVSSADRPSGKFVPQHDPFAWTDLGNGQWRAPGGAIYGEQTRQVQGVIARRAEAAQTQAGAGAQPMLMDDVAS